MFRIGLCYPQEMDNDLAGSLKRLADSGIEGIEYWDASIRKHGPEKLASVSAEAGLEVAQICPYFNFVDSEETYDESMRLGEEYLRFSKIMDARLVRVFTGRPWGGPTVGPDDATPEQWDRAVKGLQFLCDLYNRENGPDLCLECHAGSLMETSASTLRLLKDVDRPNLCVNLQLPLGGKSSPEDVHETVEALGSRTKHMHIHNFPKDRKPGICSLAEGWIDYPAIIRRLVQLGFRGYASLEHATMYVDGDVWAVARREGKWLGNLRDDLNNSQ